MDTEDLRRDMPALDDCVYLNTGASGPSPRRVVEAGEEFLEYHEYDSPAREGMYTSAADVLAETRDSVASLVNADSDESEICLTQSTTEGINIVAEALDWEEGDKAVMTDIEHSSGILPWKRLRDLHGIDVEVAETTDGYLMREEDDRDAFKDAVADANIVCLSSISWNYGTRLDVEDAVGIAHDAGAKVLVDAAQSPGQVGVDVKDWEADFVAGTGHKWLLGPWGAGFLYADSEAVEGTRSSRVGYRGVKNPNDDDFEYEDGARRFEIATLPAATYAGFAEAVKTFEEIGLGEVEDEIRRLTDRLKDGIDDDRLISPREYESGLVSFEADDPEKLVERLSDDSVEIRSIPDPHCVRVSVHAFNNSEDIDAVLERI
ncbi:MAG: aminotransferase class V-fold PLP-dependent enzyme [Halobacteria archaeon]|nr:aminotransferase class V-fold PLP-dependent enzyme [Halobacteria archaeon]